MNILDRVPPTGRVVLCGVLNAIAVLFAVYIWQLNVMAGDNATQFVAIFVIGPYILLALAIEPLPVSMVLSRLIYGLSVTKWQIFKVYTQFVGTGIVTGIVLLSIFGAVS